MSRVLWGLLGLCLGASPARALEFIGKEFNYENWSERGSLFLSPNELHPERFREKIPADTRIDNWILSVGSDRSLFHAIQFPHAAGLLVVDNAPDILEYVRMNVELIIRCPKRREYVGARNNILHPQWKNEPEADREFWSALMRVHHFEDLRWPHSGTFRGTNYLQDDEIYTRLRYFLRTKPVHYLLASVSNVAGYRKITDFAQMRNVLFSIVDLSNIETGTGSIFSQTNPFANSRAIDDFFMQLRPFLAPRAFYLFTRWVVFLEKEKFRSPLEKWDYHAVSIEAERMEAWRQKIRLAIETRNFNALYASRARSCENKVSGGTLHKP